MKHRLTIALSLFGFAALALTQTESPQQPQQAQPLTTIMQRLMTDMHTIEVGIWNENYETIRAGALQIVNHPKISDKQIKEIKGILGDQMNTFVAFDMQVHNHADSLAADARARDMPAILEHYAVIQQGCVSCHATFRTRIIEGR